VVLTLCGSGFLGSPLVFVDSNPCSNPALLPGTDDCDDVLTCILPPGCVRCFLLRPALTSLLLRSAGFLRPVVVNANSQFSAPATLVNFAIPSIDALQGCTQSGNEVVDCSRQGNQPLTILGQNFGPAGKRATSSLISLIDAQAHVCLSA